ncbi:hypothetical protein HKCCE3408_12670 [Rhodobacterales bacterium HKCCE3408]|nr:hypothetical protein [Rhodobacterales bacterium HKCCE3408]
MLDLMTQLQATLLGRFELATADGDPIRIETRKARALLAILVMARGQPMRRERLAGLLWSRGGTRQSLASLSQAVYSLKKALAEAAPDAIRADTDMVAIAVDAFTVDAWDLATAGTEDSDAGRRRCLSLYSGPFLDDLAIDTEESYSEWRTSEHTRLEGLAAAAGTALMEAWEREPENADPALVERLLAIDPYNEPAMRVRMILLARDGRQAAAVESGEAFAGLLSAELGLSPSEAFADVEARIRSGDFARGLEVPGTTGASRGSRRARPVAAALLLVVGLALYAVVWTRDAGPQTDVVRLLVRPFEAGDGIAPDLAEGFSDDLSTELVRRSGLDILSRESGRLIEEDGASGASHVLRGRMRADSDRWVLNVWITDIGTGREVWAERFRGDAGAPRDVRDEIVSRISDGIGLSLSPAPEVALVALPESAVPDYLRALSQLHSGTADGNAEAIDRLTALAEAYPDAVEPSAALVLAYERVAFEAADYARAADLHWIEGYLLLKRELAMVDHSTPDVLAAEARLALRRLDHAAAQALAREALQSDPGHVPALEILARSLALSGDTDAARSTAIRAIALAPAEPGDGYAAIATAELADGNLDAAAEAVDAAFATGREPALRLLVLRAGILGLQGDASGAQTAFGDFVTAVQSRPYAAWRVGEVAYSNPRAATWRRPTAGEAADLIRFAGPAANARLAEGLAAASGQSVGASDPPGDAELSGAEIGALLFNRRIEGRQTWLVQQEWSQTRTEEGALFQDGSFGPLPRAVEGRSDVVHGRLCDRWTWQDAEIENCQLVVRNGGESGFVLVGETGRFPFRLADAVPSAAGDR